MQRSRCSCYSSQRRVRRIKGHEVRGQLPRSGWEIAAHECILARDGASLRAVLVRIALK